MVKLPNPTGYYNAPAQALMDMVAESVQFTARLEVDTADEAHQRIHFPALETKHKIQDLLPCAVVRHGGKLHLTSQAGGDQNYVRPESGSLLLTVMDSDRGADVMTGYADFYTLAGGILKDVIDKAGKGGYLNIVDVDEVIDPSICDEEEAANGAYYVVCWRLNWN